MKLAISFLLLGVALAIPQNFYLTFHPPKNQFLPSADSSGQNAIRGPMNGYPMNQRNGYGYFPKNSFGNPYYQSNDFNGVNDNPLAAERMPSIYSSQDDDVIEGRNPAQSRFLFGGGGFLYPFLPNFSSRIITLFAYTTTVNSTMTMSVVSTCIPTGSFISPASTLPCTSVAAGRKKRSFGEDGEEFEGIYPSQVQDVVPTAVEELKLERQVGDLQIESSQDERHLQTPNRGRQKRFFFGVPTITLTSIITTSSTLTVFTQFTTTSSLTLYSSFTCLPPGTAVCR